MQNFWDFGRITGYGVSKRLLGPGLRGDSSLQRFCDQAPEPSQTIMNATAARYFLFWVNVSWQFQTARTKQLYKGIWTRQLYRVIYVPLLASYVIPTEHINIPWYTSIKKSFFVMYIIGQHTPSPLFKNIRLCVAGCFRKQIPTNSMFKFHECLGSKNNIYLIYVKFRAIFFYSECFFGLTYIYIYMCVCVCTAWQASGSLCGISSSYGSFDASAWTCFPCSCLPWIQGVLLDIPLKHEQIGAMGFGPKGLQIPPATETTPAGAPSPLFAQEPTVPCKLFVGGFHLQIKSFGWKVPCAFHVEAGVAKICHICWLAVAQHVTTNVCCVQKRSSSTMILTDLHSYPVFYLRYTRCPKTWQRTLIQVTKPDSKNMPNLVENRTENDFFGS